jgi:hemerythrin-like domain-containing protein
MTAPNLLNDDGTASMATMLMMSHHAFRRDLRRFASALAKLAAGDGSRIDSIRNEWQWYRNALHGHHGMEDANVFPSLKAQAPALAPTLERLTAEHHAIDPLLERGDRAFADLPKTDAAIAVVSELGALLEPHLALEEAEIVGFLRAARQFPTPASEDEAKMYAQGFAWSLNGIAPEVVDEVYKLLPEALLSKLAGARAAFDQRCVAAWGTAEAGAARTPIPDRS